MYKNSYYISFHLEVFDASEKISIEHSFLTELITLFGNFNRVEDFGCPTIYIDKCSYSPKAIAHYLSAKLKGLSVFIWSKDRKYITSSNRYSVQPIVKMLQSNITIGGIEKYLEEIKDSLIADQKLLEKLLMNVWKNERMKKSS